VLCGRNAVQLTLPSHSMPLDELAKRLDGVGRVTRNPFLLRLKLDTCELTLFPTAARSCKARMIRLWPGRFMRSLGGRTASAESPRPIGAG
jgi:hypothetical protein